MKKCVYYQSKPICTECEGQEDCPPLVLVNNLLGGDHSTIIQWEFVNKRSFSNFYQGDQNNTVLKYKYIPPKTSELLNGQTPKSDGHMSYKQSHSHMEFYPEYLNLDNPSLKSSGRSFPIFGHFSLNSYFHKKEIGTGEKDRGFWCVFSGSSSCSSNKNKLHSTTEFLGKTCSGRTLNHKESIYSAFSKERGSSTFASQLNQKYDMQSLKRKYGITNYHRGKWIISTKEKSSFLWKEICKLISTRELVHCNAKYQEWMKEIWIYCDFIESLDIHEILTRRMNIIPQGLPYCIRPHGIIMTIEV